MGWFWTAIIGGLLGLLGSLIMAWPGACDCSKSAELSATAGYTRGLNETTEMLGKCDED